MFILMLSLASYANDDTPISFPIEDVTGFRFEVHDLTENHAQRLKLNNDELMALANAMASKFDQSLETGTLNDALTQHEQTVAQIAPAIQAQQA